VLIQMIGFRVVEALTPAATPHVNLASTAEKPGA
jgi:hypothetical protein